MSPPPAVALLAFTPTAEPAPAALKPYPGLPPPPPPPRRLAALATVSAAAASSGSGHAPAATPAALWTARAARAFGPGAPVLLVTRAGGDEGAAAAWADLSPAGAPAPALVALAAAGGGGGGEGRESSLVGRAARAAAAAAPAGSPLLLVDADAVPAPWVDLARLVAAARVLGSGAVPVAAARPPASLVAGGALAAGGGWWETETAAAAAPPPPPGPAGPCCPGPLGAPVASPGASPAARLALPLLYLPAVDVGAFAAAADGAWADSLGAAVAAWRAGGAAVACLPLPAPLPSSATRAGRALAAALLAKPPAALADAASIADLLDGSRPAAAAFGEALMEKAGVEVVASSPPAASQPAPPPATRHAPPPRPTHPAYTTTNAAYGARPPAPHEVAALPPLVAARVAARAALPPLSPPVPGAGKERGMRLAGAGQWLAN